MARRTKEQALETRENILKAAIDMIYEKGYARSTFVDIAGRINLTKGAIYWHFKNKPEVFLALGKQMEERIETALQDLFGEADNLASLKQILYEMIHFTAKDDQVRKYYTIVFYRMEWTDELLPIKEFFNRKAEEIVDFVVGILKKAQQQAHITQHVDPQVASHALLAFFDGLLGYCLSSPVK